MIVYIVDIIRISVDSEMSAHMDTLHFHPFWYFQCFIIHVRILHVLLSFHDVTGSSPFLTIK